MVKKYTTVNDNVIQVGDTVILGNPTSQEFSSRTYSGSYGNKGRVGVSNSRSTSKKTYDFIQLGRPAGFGSIMSAMSGEAVSMADNSIKNTKVIVKEISNNISKVFLIFINFLIIHSTLLYKVANI